MRPSTSCRWSRSCWASGWPATSGPHSSRSRSSSSLDGWWHSCWILRSAGWWTRFPRLPRGPAAAVVFLVVAGLALAVGVGVTLSFTDSARDIIARGSSIQDQVARSLSAIERCEPIAGLPARHPRPGGRARGVRALAARPHPRGRGGGRPQRGGQRCHHHLHRDGHGREEDRVHPVHAPSRAARPSPAVRHVECRGGSLVRWLHPGSVRARGVVRPPRLGHRARLRGPVRALHRGHDRAPPEHPLVRPAGVVDPARGGHVRVHARCPGAGTRVDRSSVGSSCRTSCRRASSALRWASIPSSSWRPCSSVAPWRDPSGRSSGSRSQRRSPLSSRSGSTSRGPAGRVPPAPPRAPATAQAKDRVGDVTRIPRVMPGLSVDPASDRSPRASKSQDVTRSQPPSGRRPLERRAVQRRPAQGGRRSSCPSRRPSSRHS